MNYGDISRWEAEIDSWRQRYEALLKTVADSQSLAPPMMLADKQSYELGFLHGVDAEREACAKVCDEMWTGRGDLGAICSSAIRARSKT